jgi:hypothetical protein
MRKLMPSDFLRAELLKAIKYPEIRIKRKTSYPIHGKNGTCHIPPRKLKNKRRKTISPKKTSVRYIDSNTGDSERKIKTHTEKIIGIVPIVGQKAAMVNPAKKSERNIAPISPTV